jgi:heptaprenyl diphosphate synthase
VGATSRRHAPLPSAAGTLDLAHLRTDLERVQAELLTAVECDDPLLTDIAGHLLLAGGKRLRPAFCLAAARAAEPVAAPASPAAIRAAASVELVHLGSLYHDDVMDKATTRRGVATVNARWGDLKAILGGDFLLARASELASSLGTEIAGILAHTIAVLSEGQVCELRAAYDVSRSESSYQSAVEGKTGELFAAACRIGALTGGVGAVATDALTEFGRRYGIAFQIIDDVLDVVAEPEMLGKPSGSDLAQGVYTLPVLRALQSGDGAPLRRLLGRPLSGAELSEARRLVQANGAIASARDDAARWARDAVAALDGLGESPALAALRAHARLLVA